MFVTTNNKIGFIHVPKCGGTSVFKSFDALGRNDRGNPWSPWSIYKTHTSFGQIWPEKIPKDFRGFPGPEQWFTSVRNPYARYHTWYYFAMEWTKKRLSGELPLKGSTEEQIRFGIKFLEEQGPKGVLKKLHEFEGDRSKISQFKLGNIYNPQVNWFQGCYNCKIFKLEQIELMWEWLKSLGCPVEYTHAKKTSSKVGTWHDFDEETLVLIQKRYERDFRELDYPMVV